MTKCWYVFAFKLMKLSVCSIPLFYSRTILQVVYVTSLIRTIIALHNLINNKLTNRDVEKKDTKKPEEKKEEIKEDKKEVKVK